MRQLQPEDAPATAPCGISLSQEQRLLPQLTEQGRQRIDELAQRYAVSTDAVMTLLQALVNSNGNMAQFNHPELGGGASGCGAA